MASRPSTLSARLEVVEGAIYDQGATLTRLEAKVDSIGLNGSTEHIKALAAAAPALVALAGAAPELVELATERSDRHAAARYIGRSRLGRLVTRDIGTVPLAALIGGTYAIVEILHTLGVHIP